VWEILGRNINLAVISRGEKLNYSNFQK
jgi:hypothetical protein